MPILQPNPFNDRHPVRWRAFTLVEVIVAMALLAFTITAAMGALGRCAVASNHARRLSQAVLLAERLLNETRLTPQTNYATHQGDEDTYQWTVSLDPTPIENLGAVHVLVLWQEQQRPQQYELLSLINMTLAESQGGPS